MAAFKASPEKLGVAAADEAKEKPAARGGARRGPKRTRARHARRWNGGARAARSKELLPHGHRIGGPITERRFAWLNRRLAFGTEGRGGTPRNRTRRDFRDDQQHDRREDLSEGPRARGRLTERESFLRSKSKGEEIMATAYQTEDKILPRRAL